MDIDIIKYSGLIALVWNIISLCYKLIKDKNIKYEDIYKNNIYEILIRKNIYDKFMESHLKLIGLTDKEAVKNLLQGIQIQITSAYRHIEILNNISPEKVAFIQKFLTSYEDELFNLYEYIIKNDKNSFISLETFAMHTLLDFYSLLNDLVLNITIKDIKKDAARIKKR